MEHYKKRRGVRVLGALALTGGAFTGLAALGSTAFSGTAGAVSGSTTPTNNPSNPVVTYEEDCSGTLPSVGY